MPFFPLVPVAALAVGVALLFALPTPGMIGGGLWLALGLVVYLTYGRTHLMEAQEGVLVFGPEPDREKKEGAYRILVPLSRGVERHLLLGLATALASQTEGEVIPLQVIPITDPLAIAEGRRIARERNTLFQWSTRMASRSGVPLSTSSYSSERLEMVSGFAVTRHRFGAPTAGDVAHLLAGKSRLSSRFAFCAGTSQALEMSLDIETTFP